MIRWNRNFQYLKFNKMPKNDSWNPLNKWDKSKKITLELTLEQCQQIKELVLRENTKGDFTKILVALDTQIDKQMVW